jgi:hypothetical protein
MAKRPSCGHRIPTILPVIWGNDQSLRTATDWHDGQITRTGEILSSATSSAKLDPVAKA